MFILAWPSPAFSSSSFFFSGTNSVDLFLHVSSLNREEASLYNLLQTNRLISTTITAMISVDASNTSNLPLSLAALMVLPNPSVDTILP